LCNHLATELGDKTIMAYAPERNEPSGLAAPIPRVQVLGVPVDVVDTARVLSFAERALRDGSRGARIVAVNPEKVVAVGRDEWLRNFLRAADLLIPDGIGVVWAAKLLAGAAVQRVTGADLMQELCALATRDGHPIFLFGGKEEVSEAAAAKLRARFPALKIAGRANGYLPPTAMGDLVDTINRSGAKILFVALGSPRQERWIAEYGAQLHVNLIQGIGGTLDVLAGEVKRAPKAWQRANLEWLFRLLSDPRRIRRQSALPVFTVRVLWALAGATARRLKPGPRPG
jgi:N-acetylglucosaminyldiphosphoundecaprenol N-acetyl-beta-D-mannosaminyltransferase